MSEEAEAPRTRKLKESDYLLLGLLTIMVYLASFGLAKSISAGTFLGSSQSSLPALDQLSPYAEEKNGVQEAYVDTSFGFNPQTIFAKPDIPLNIEFGPAEAGGCYESIYFPELGIDDVDLTDGAVVEIGPLEPGQYQWACWMDMAFGLIVVE